MHIKIAVGMVLAILVGCGGEYAQRAAPSVPQADARAQACRANDSRACLAIGQSLHEQHDYRQAREFLDIGCGRIRNSVQQNARRIVELDAILRPAWKRVRDVASGQPQPAEDDHSLETIKSLEPETNEIKARMESCIAAGDTHDMEDEHSRAIPYYDIVCQFSAINDEGQSLIPGFDSLTGSACDSGQFSRQQRAQDQAFRAQMAGIVAQGLSDMGHTIVRGTAQVEAAKRGELLGNDGIARSTSTSGGGCADHGQSCQSDPAVTSWKQRCTTNPPSQAPCQCAAAATYQCFIAHGCYAEAGAKNDDGSLTTTTLAQLRDGQRQSSANAARLGTTCP